MDERPRPSEPDVYLAADVACQAINLNKKMGFGYCYNGLDGNEHLLAAPDGGNEFHETPISLIFSNGNYYLETWPEVPNESLPRKHYSRRLDRIRSPRLLDEDAESNSEIEALKRSVPRRISQTFDMFGDGIERYLFLKVSSLAASNVLARFGHACKFENLSKDADGNEYGFLLVAVQLSPTFYRWFMPKRKIPLAKIVKGCRVVRKLIRITLKFRVSMNFSAQSTWQYRPANLFGHIGKEIRRRKCFRRQVYRYATKA